MSQLAQQGAPARRPPRRLAPAIALAAALFLAATSQARADCPGEWNTPSQLSTTGARSALLCLVNEQRTANGLGALARNGSLGRAAQHHSRAMDARNFFGHEGDGSPPSRAKHTGYMAGTSWWMIGEALAWGRGSRGTPAGTIGAMMASPTHREEILDSTYRDVGVGVAMGVPVPESGQNAAIYTVDFGVRK